MLAVRGNVENRVVLDRAPIERATVLVVAIPDPVTTRFVVDTVRRAASAAADRRPNAQPVGAGRPPAARRDGGRRRRGGARARDDPVHAAAVRRERPGADLAHRGPAPPLIPVEIASFSTNPALPAAYDRRDSRLPGAISPRIGVHLEGGRTCHLEMRLSSRTSGTCTASATRRSCFRSMGGFSNFAISFSIISILTGAVILYDYGLAWAGKAAVSLGWPLVTIFVLCIAAAMAEIASAYPTAGGLYYWAIAAEEQGLGLVDRLAQPRRPVLDRRRDQLRGGGLPQRDDRRPDHRRHVRPDRDTFRACSTASW